MASADSATTGHYRLRQRLDAEWDRLVASPQAAAALLRWGRQEPDLAGWCDLQQLRAAVHNRQDPGGGDRLLAALVRRAAVTGGDDRLAARVVLQLLVPGAVRLAGSLRTYGGDPSTEAAVFAELTILIRSYPWQRRPGRIAANLLLDCRQRLVRSYRRTRAELPAGLTPDLEHPRRVHDLPGAGGLEHELGLHDLLWWAHRNGVLDPFEARLLVASRVQQIPMTALASHLGRSRSGLFRIRAAAEQRLRQALVTSSLTADVGEVTCQQWSRRHEGRQ